MNTHNPIVVAASAMSVATIALRSATTRSRPSPQALSALLLSCDKLHSDHAHLQCDYDWTQSVVTHEQLMAQVLQKITDQHIILQGTWEQFKLIQQGSEDSPGVRLFYYDSTIELLMPGFQHETFSEILGYLVTTYLLSRGIIFVPSGSVTQEKEGQASAQADKSYCLGGAKPIPDLSIEVIFSSGSTTQLMRYAALGVPEVWFWEDGVLTLHHLRRDGYERVDRSQLPGLEHLDISLLKRCILMAETDFPEAVRLFQQGI